MKNTIVALSSALFFVAGSAFAGRFVVEARYEDGSMIDSGTYQSMKETQQFRENVKGKVCGEKGKGKHIWFYKVGKQKPVKSTAFCK
jgi:hypothetical protein